MSEELLAHMEESDVPGRWDWANYTVIIPATHTGFELVWDQKETISLCDDDEVLGTFKTDGSTIPNHAWFVECLAKKKYKAFGYMNKGLMRQIFTSVKGG